MATTKWLIDSMHSEIGFKVKHMMITNVHGKFETFSAEALTNGDSFDGASVSFSADVKSIQTGVEDRDKHLLSDDFFNAEKYPKLTFKGTKLINKNNDVFELTGDLTIRDVTKPITLDVEYAGIVSDPYGQVKAGFVITGKLKRSDFNLKWSAVTEAGSIVVADEIKINCEVQLIKQA